MKVLVWPAGGRFGYGFDYYCADCGEYIGCSDGPSNPVTLEHPTKIEVDQTGFVAGLKIFFGGTPKPTTAPSPCRNAGKSCAAPLLIFECPELPQPAAGGRDNLP